MKDWIKWFEPEVVMDEEKEKKVDCLVGDVRAIKSFRILLKNLDKHGEYVGINSIDNELDDLMLCIQTEIGKLVCEE